MHHALARLAFALLALAALSTPVRADTVYFVSKDTGGLYQFNTASGGITSLTGTNTFPDATALAMGPDGNLYVGDATNGGSIRRYTMAGGAVETVVTLSGSNPAFGNGPVSPTAIAFTPGGTMLVGRNPQAEFNGYPSGQVLAVVGWNGGSPTVQDYTSGTTPNYQTGFAVAPNGSLYASNTTYDLFAQPQPALIGNVLSFNSSGTFQSVVAVDGSGTGGLYGPTGLALSGDLLYIASTMDGNIYKTDLTNPNTATNTTLFASTDGTFIGPLAMLPDGSVLTGYVGGFVNRGKILQFDASGSLINTFGATEYGAIGGIVAVPEPTAVMLALVGAACVGLARLRRRGA